MSESMDKTEKQSQTDQKPAEGINSEYTKCPACGAHKLSKVQMPIEGFCICANCYSTILPWSKLQTVKRELMFLSRKKWADALLKAPEVQLNPVCPEHGTPLVMAKIKEYGQTQTWQHEDPDCEQMVLTPSVMSEILIGSTQIREEFTATKYRSKEKWNPLAFVGKLFASKKDESLDDMLEDLQFLRKIAPALGLHKSENSEGPEPSEESA